MTAAIPPTARELIENHQGLVRSLAIQVLRKFHLQVELDDLVAYGQVGLAEAAQQFDPNRGTQFSTYAYYRIRGALYDGISKMAWVGRGGGRQFRFQQMGGEVLHDDQQASSESDETRTVDSESAWLVQLTRKLTVVYLSAGIAEDVASKSDSDDCGMPSTPVMRRELYERLHALIEGLPADERRLLNATYFDGLTLQDAAEQQGISKSWASRLHGKALQRLAQALRRSGLAE